MCDILVRVLPDRVLFAKNSDREADEPQHLRWQPRMRHPPGTKVQCTFLSIPQAETTYAVLLSSPSFIWGAEMGTNEHGVTIGNEAVFTRQAVPKIGLTGMDLLRLALERADSAEQAIQVIVTLMEAHGQGGGCGYKDRGFRYFSSFVIADRRGAFVLETAGSAWAVEKVQGARSISNALTIPLFAESHSDFLKTQVAASHRRRACTESSAAAATTLPDLARALRDHGEKTGAPGWPRYSVINGAMHLPCMHAGGLIAASQTTASWISELGPAGARHFATATAAPCLSLFKPVGIFAEKGIDVGPHPGPGPDASLWWRHERLHRMTMRDPARLAPLFLADRDAIEARFLAGRVDDVKVVQAAWDEAQEVLVEWTARVAAAAKETGGNDRRPWWVRRYWKKCTPCGD